MFRHGVTLALLFLFIALVSLVGVRSDQVTELSAATMRAESNQDYVSTHKPIVTRPSSDREVVLMEDHPLDPLIHFAREIQQHIEANVDDFTATMIKRERIQGKLGGETRMLLKVRNRKPASHQPLSAYMKFLEPKAAQGREVIWTENANSNRLISHEGGFLNIKRFNLEPEGLLAMMGNKYPITEVGLLRLTEKLIEKGERDRELDTAIVEIIEHQRVGDRECRLYQIIHPRKVEGLDFHIAQVFVDVERMIPLRYAAFLWPDGDEEPPLEEEYTYLDLQLNVGLTDQDFDPDNPNYNFP